MRDPAEWFPVTGRHVFRLDPSYVEGCGRELDTAAAVAIAAADMRRRLLLESVTTAGEEITEDGESSSSEWKNFLMARVPQEDLLGSRGATFEGRPGSVCLSSAGASGVRMNPYIATQGTNGSFTPQGPLEVTPPVGDSRHRSDGSEEIFSRAPGK